MKSVISKYMQIMATDTDVSPMSIEIYFNFNVLFDMLRKMLYDTKNLFTQISAFRTAAPPQ